MTPNWDDMKVALAIARAGSMTRAAEALGIDQSTCGRRLGALEAALGAVLFIRSKTGLAPTEAGEAAIARASEIELRMDRLAEHLARGPEGPVGLVRLVGNGWTLQLLAERAVGRLLAEHPRLDLRLVAAHPKVPVRPEATLGLWFEAPPRDAEFAITLCAVPYALYARRGADPAALPWTGLYDEDAPRLAPTRALERRRKRDERLRLTTTDVAAQLAAVRAGLGRGLLPMCLAEPCAELARLPDPEPPLVRPLQLHMHPDTVQAARVQAVVRWLRETADDVFGASRYANAGDSV
jgi:DNA-binding transcriptional LysR family regulator